MGRYSDWTLDMTPADEEMNRRDGIAPLRTPQPPVRTAAPEPSLADLAADAAVEAELSAPEPPTPDVVYTCEECQTEKPAADFSRFEEGWDGEEPIAIICDTCCDVLEHAPEPQVTPPAEQPARLCLCPFHTNTPPAPRCIVFCVVGFEFRACLDGQWLPVAFRWHDAAEQALREAAIEALSNYQVGDGPIDAFEDRWPLWPAAA